MKRPHLQDEGPLVLATPGYCAFSTVGLSSPAKALASLRDFIVSSHLGRRHGLRTCSVSLLSKISMTSLFRAFLTKGPKKTSMRHRLIWA